uniref:Uncharacterized protein n=1 Tax=Romanomermis culicivorax TaxID=13658 RepID=A0A915KAM7_ROMCU
MSGKARYEVNYKAIYCFDIDRLWSFFKLIGPIILLIIYTLIGALIFSLAEADHEKQQRLEKNLNYTKFKNDALKELK